LTEIGTQRWGPQILIGIAPQIVDPISKITSISNLLSLPVERPGTLGGKRKKETSVEK